MNNSNVRKVNILQIKNLVFGYLPKKLKDINDPSFEDLTKEAFKAIDIYFNKLLDEKTYTNVKVFLLSHILELYVVDITIASIDDIIEVRMDQYNAKLIMIFAKFIEKFEDELIKDNLQISIKLININKFTKFNDIILDSIDIIIESNVKKRSTRLIKKIKTNWTDIDSKTFTDTRSSIEELLKYDLTYEVNKSKKIITKNIEPFVSYHSLTITCPICGREHLLENDNKEEIILRVPNSTNLYYLFCDHDTKHDNNELRTIERIDIKKYKQNIDDNTNIIDFIIYNFDLLSKQVIKNFMQYKNSIEEV